jgi:hypothetical protein
VTPRRREGLWQKPDDICGETLHRERFLRHLCGCDCCVTAAPLVEASTASIARSGARANGRRPPAPSAARPACARGFGLPARGSQPAALTGGDPANLTDPTGEPGVPRGALCTQSDGKFKRRYPRFCHGVEEGFFEKVPRTWHLRGAESVARLRSHASMTGRIARVETCRTRARLPAHLDPVRRRHSQLP